MSRTKRFKAAKYKVFREPQTKNAQTAENYAAQAMNDEGFNTTNRHLVRGNPKSKKIPSAFDDLSISAINESDYKKGKFLFK